MNEIFQTTVENAESVPVPFDFALTQEEVGENGPIIARAISAALFL